jgi:hypothetical protein
MKNEDLVVRSDEQAGGQPQTRDRKPPVVTREDIADAKPRAEQVEQAVEERPKQVPTQTAPPEETAPAEAHAKRQREGLFEGDRSAELHRRWTEVQSRFVDDPREAVKSADALVDEVIRDLSALFTDERSKLEAHLGKNEDASTEDLRVALRRYRAFFERLLSI